MRLKVVVIATQNKGQDLGHAGAEALQDTESGSHGLSTSGRKVEKSGQCRSGYGYTAVNTQQRCGSGRQAGLAAIYKVAINVGSVHKAAPL